MAVALSGGHPTPRVRVTWRSFERLLDVAGIAVPLTDFCDDCPSESVV